MGHCACGRQPPLLIKPQILEVRSAPLSALRVRLRSSADLITPPRELIPEGRRRQALPVDPEWSRSQALFEDAVGDGTYFADPNFEWEEEVEETKHGGS